MDEDEGNGFDGERAAHLLALRLAVHHLLLLLHLLRDLLRELWWVRATNYPHERATLWMYVEHNCTLV